MYCLKMGLMWKSIDCLPPNLTPNWGAVSGFPCLICDTECPPHLPVSVVKSMTLEGKG